MKITLEKTLVTDTKADMIVLGLFNDKNEKCTNYIETDKLLNGIIAKDLIKNGEFDCKYLSIYKFPTLGKLSQKSIMLIGLGERADYTIDNQREVCQTIVKNIKKENNVKIVAVSLPICEENMLCPQAVAEGLILGEYDFDKYKTDKKESKLSQIILAHKNPNKDMEKALKRGELFGEAANFARDLINEPAEYSTPTKLSKVAEEIAKSNSEIEVEVLEKDECEKMGMGAYTAVGRGSSQPLKFIHLTYKPKTIAECKLKKIALIGKGITFDSGGYSIKPASSMLDMKDDMSGGAAVLGVMKFLPKLMPNMEVHGIIAACENMLSGCSYKPGDILRAKNGKTIEVDNTDAEGRLTLADALCFAERDLKVDEIIDMATLTGACVVGLGHYAAGIFGNNQKMIEKVKAASSRSDEMMWQLPLLKAHFDSLKSDVADMKNTGSRQGGASVAAAFLKEFVEKTDWVHIDIAGTAFIDKPYRGFIKGATGYGVRTLLEYLTL